MSTQLFRASQEWATRPDDQRFLSLADLRASVAKRRSECWTSAIPANRIRVLPAGDDGSLSLQVPDVSHGRDVLVKPTHWGFGQLASYASAPAGYLRRLPAELAAINLQWGLERDSVRDDALCLCQSNGDQTMRAMTSTSYGRIWDEDVVQAVERVNADGRWQVPAASYATANPKRATTLYASDRDVFLFLVDPSRPIAIPGQAEPMFRGFFCWNSETGAATFGLTTFLYNRVCDNRIVWGAQQVKELSIRHTGGAPDRFAYEGAKALRHYSEASADDVVRQITAAQAVEIEVPKGKTVADWLSARGFTRPVAKAAEQAAVAEEGEARTLWQIVQGVTAHARTIAHADERVALERDAGKLLATARAE